MTTEKVEKVEEDAGIPTAIEAHIDLTALHLDYFINLVTNTVNFSGEFTLETVEALMIRMDFLMLHNPEMDINLRISSYGGEAYALFSLIDYIHSLPVKVNGFAFGAAMSSGAWLLTCLTGKRYMGKNATLLIHEGATAMDGKTSDMISTATQMQWIRDTMLTMLVKHTKKTKKFWTDGLTKELYLDAETCLKYGMIDAIGGQSAT
jgi:ATP-dependent Clp protease, protease subunit